MAKASADLCDYATLVYFEEASHWVKDEEAERVNNILLNFFIPGADHRQPTD